MRGRVTKDQREVSGSDRDFNRLRNGSRKDVLWGSWGEVPKTYCFFSHRVVAYVKPLGEKRDLLKERAKRTSCDMIGGVDVNLIGVMVGQGRGTAENYQT